MILKNTTLDDQKFYATMMTIAVPVVIQHLISIGLNMVDTIMIGRLGEVELAAVGIANRIYFIFAIFCFGFYSGASVFISQYWGIKDVKNIRKVFGLEIVIGFLVALFFSIIVIFFPVQVMSLFIKEASVIAYGVEYLKIIGFSFVFIAMSFAMSFNSRSIHLLKRPTLINVIAIVTNTFLNYILIYGNFGFPALGVKGAAYATLIARLLEFTMLILYIYSTDHHPLRGNFSDYFGWEAPFVKKVFRTSLPVFINESMWVLGTSVYYIAYGMIGSDAVAVVQVTFTISDFFQSVFFGIGSACAVMIGNELGRNETELAFDYARRFIKITFIFSILVSVLLYLLKNPIIAFYDFSENTNYMLGMSLIVAALYMTPKMETYMIIVGILRSGGDTRFCMIVDMIFVWLVGVPLAFITVLVFKWPIYLVLAAVFSEEAMKFFVVYHRVKAQKWIRSLIADVQ
jgi:putative MATE family efflux protein